MTTIDEWSVSGLCVTARPDRLVEIEETIAARPGFEVHARHPRTCKLVVIQERMTIEEHRRGLRELQQIPGVLTAELVLHYRDTSDEPDPPTSGGAP